jgi:hypothetical protein
VVGSEVLKKLGEIWGDKIVRMRNLKLGIKQQFSYSGLICIRRAETSDSIRPETDLSGKEGRR